MPLSSHPNIGSIKRLARILSAISGSWEAYQEAIYLVRLIPHRSRYLITNATNRFEVPPQGAPTLPFYKVCDQNRLLGFVIRPISRAGHILPFWRGFFFSKAAFLLVALGTACPLVLGF